jgi:glutaredoxin
MLKDYLQSKTIAFEEKMVDQDKQAQEQMIEDSGGFLGVPFTVIVKDDGSKETIVGFDKDRVNEAIGIK